MKTVARYLYPFYAESVAFDGSYVSTIIRPTQVAVNEFIGYDPTEEAARGILPGVEPVFARRILSSSATLAPQTYTVTQMTELAIRSGSYYAVEQGTGGTELVFIIDINDPILTYTSFQNVPGGYNVQVNANNTINISLRV